MICGVLGALQVVDGVKWLNALSHTSYSIDALSKAEKIEISLSVVLLSFAIIMSFLSYQMSKQFGWNIYKKLGADVKIQSMFINYYGFVFQKTHHLLLLFRNVSCFPIFCISFKN